MFPAVAEVLERQERAIRELTVSATGKTQRNRRQAQLLHLAIRQNEEMQRTLVEPLRSGYGRRLPFSIAGALVCEPAK